MTNKRNHPENEDVESALYHKRSRPNNPDGSDELPTSSQPRIDPTYGQRGAFPGLDGSQDDDVFYGPASDGLEYLRMVRLVSQFPASSQAIHAETPFLARKPKCKADRILFATDQKPRLSPMSSSPPFRLLSEPK